MQQSQMPPLNTLRAFEAAARHGGFSRAAQELHVTPAAVSHRVRELEQSLRVALFVRKSRGVTLTEAGRRYRDALSDALARIERATANVQLDDVDGPLSLSVPESFAQA